MPHAGLYPHYWRHPLKLDEVRTDNGKGAKDQQLSEAKQRVDVHRLPPQAPISAPVVTTTMQKVATIPVTIPVTIPTPSRMGCSTLNQPIPIHELSNELSLALRQHELLTQRIYHLDSLGQSQLATAHALRLGPVPDAVPRPMVVRHQTALPVQQLAAEHQEETSVALLSQMEELARLDVARAAEAAQSMELLHQRLLYVTDEGMKRRVEEEEAKVRAAAKEIAEAEERKLDMEHKHVLQLSAVLKQITDLQAMKSVYDVNVRINLDTMFRNAQRLQAIVTTQNAARGAAAALADRTLQQLRSLQAVHGDILTPQVRNTAYSRWTCK